MDMHKYQIWTRRDGREICDMDFQAPSVRDMLNQFYGDGWTLTEEPSGLIARRMDGTMIGRIVDCGPLTAEVA